MDSFGGFPSVRSNTPSRKKVLPPTEVASSEFRLSLSKPLPQDKTVDILKDIDLEMLEFPLPKKLWQKNSDARRCACCTNSFRRLKGRRHHCRICGKCVCAICSVHRLRGYRICKNCKNNPDVQRRFRELLGNWAMAVQMDPETIVSESYGVYVQMDPETIVPNAKPSYTTDEENKLDFLIGGSLSGSPKQRKPKTGASSVISDSQSMYSDFFRSSTLVGPSVDLSQWKTVHCVSWIKSLGLKENEEKTIAAIKDLGFCGTDLQAISDGDLQSELKIYSAIHRRRILLRLKQLTQDVVDDILKKEEENEVLSKKDLSRLARDVQDLKRGNFQAVDRIVMLNCPENKYQVDWYATSIEPGIHKVTVIDQNNITNSSYWILKHQGHAIETHCLSTNPTGLRWRLHNSTVQLCTNNNTDELNTHLVISLQSVTLPKSANAELIL